MVNGLFICPIKATGKKQSGNKASQFFYKLVLALLGRLAGATTNTSADWSQYPICAGVGWVSLARLPCLYLASMLQYIVWPAVMLFRLRAVCLASLYSFHPVWAVCKPFSQLPNRSASFQTGSAWFINGITVLCIIESGPTSLKTGWPVYKLVACLQTGQVCNRFTTYMQYLSKTV